MAAVDTIPCIHFKDRAVSSNTPRACRTAKWKYTEYIDTLNQFDEINLFMRMADFIKSAHVCLLGGGESGALVGCLSEVSETQPLNWRPLCYYTQDSPMYLMLSELLSLFLQY